MAKIPTAESLGARPVPETGGGIARLDLATPQLGHSAAALAELGASVSKVGETMFTIAQNEKKKISILRTEDATNKYTMGTLDLELSEKDGFTNIRGGEVVKRPLMDEYRKRREEMAKKIRDELPDDDARMAFDQRAMIIDRQFDARLYRHISEQTRAYQGVVYEGTLDTETRMAAQLWDQPGQIELSLLRINKTIEDKAAKDGLDKENPDDRMVIEQLKSISRSRLYSDVIDVMLVQGKDSAAAAFYEKIKGTLTPESLITMGAKVENASIDGEAMRGADEAWALLGPKTRNDPVQLDVMEQWIRNKYKDDPRKARAGIAEIRSRATAHNETEREVAATNKAKVLGAFHDGATLRQLQTMPEYHALDGQEQSQIKDYVQSSARREFEYEESEKTRLGNQRFWELSAPARLATMSEAQILALEPELGQHLTDQLMGMKRKLAGSKEVLAATIDAEQFNAIAAEAGLNPYNKPNGTQREQLGRLRNRVEAVIDLAQQKKGGQLTREEKDKLMRDVITPKVMIDEWGSDPQMPAAAVPYKERSNVYVPLSEIEPSWLKGAINYMRSTGAAPMAWTDSKIKEKFQDRLEKAYGLSITGGSAADGRKLLEGK